jgi:hypothetical protein
VGTCGGASPTHDEADLSVTSHRTSPAPLSLVEGAYLAYALVQHVARTAGVRVLFVKGLTVEAQGLRAPRVSSDVDVLVDPGQVDQIIELLGGYGWIARPDSSAPRFFSLHSRSLHHTDWPCDIDVHGSYPGFFADAENVFDILWQGRRPMLVAGHDIDVPAPAASACILAAHAIRNAMDPRSEEELGYLTRAVLSGPSRLALLDIAELAGRLRAGETLRPWLADLGVDAGIDDLTPAERRAWNLRLASGGTTSYHWWVRWHTARWRERPAVAVRIALVGSRAVLRRRLSLSEIVTVKVREFQEARTALRASEAAVSYEEDRS